MGKFLMVIPLISWLLIMAIGTYLCAKFYLWLGHMILRRRLNSLKPSKEDDCQKQEGVDAPEQIAYKINGSIESIQLVKDEQHFGATRPVQNLNRGCRPEANGDTKEDTLDVISHPLIDQVPDAVHTESLPKGPTTCKQNQKNSFP